jgi:predicted nucleic acid-binding protein
MIGTTSVRRNRDKARNQGAKFYVPPFVQYEIQRGLLINSNIKHELAYNRLIENCEESEMTATTWRKAAEIYASLYIKRFTVKDSDIVIAAFCIVNGYTLVTNNTKDFENMDGLLYIDWVE